MVSSCLACCIFFQSLIGAKVITLCFAMFVLFFEFCARTSPQDLTAFSHLGNWAEISPT